MTFVLLASASPDVHALVHAATDGRMTTADPLLQDPADLLPAPDPAAPGAVVLVDTAALGAAGALELAARLDRSRPDVGVVLLGGLTTEEALAAMRAGVRDVVGPLEQADAVRRAVDRAGSLARGRHAALHAEGGVAATAGRVIAVVSPKGGAGKTTVATNLGVGLARAVPGSTVLVDLDLQFGDVEAGLGLHPQHRLPDAVRGRAGADSMVVKTYLSEHESGLYVLCAPKQPADADGITSEQIDRLLALLAGEFRYVVVDTAPGLPEHTVSVLDMASDLVLVSSMDGLGLRALRTELATLDELEMEASRQIVLNFGGERAAVPLAQAEELLGGSVDVVIPVHKEVAASVDQGVPLLHGRRRGPAARSLHQVVERYLPARARAVKVGAANGRHRGAE